MIYIKKIDFFKDNRGMLASIDHKKFECFSIKRTFFINFIKSRVTRGKHAHKKCSQFLFPILGKIKVEHVSKDKAGSVLLDFSKKEGILLKPKTWCKIKFLTKNAILLVACDMEYQFSDYIESYQEFLKIIKKRKIK